MGKAAEAIRQQPMAYLDQPACGVMHIFVHRVELGLGRIAAAARQLLDDGFAGTVVSDRCFACSWLPLEQRWSLIGTVKQQGRSQGGAGARRAEPPAVEGILSTG
jgi:hypothetical protein